LQQLLYGGHQKKIEKEIVDIAVEMRIVTPAGKQ
jgi:hypothetical protein